MSEHGTAGGPEVAVGGPTRALVADLPGEAAPPVGVERRVVESASVVSCDPDDTSRTATPGRADPARTGHVRQAFPIAFNMWSIA
ncbi:MAG: hypothetical protein U1E39_04660 [Planctomycetota bacterium]